MVRGGGWVSLASIPDAEESTQPPLLPEDKDQEGNAGGGLALGGLVGSRNGEGAA
eukprot:CAMPEP_0174937664 /NCGR_PEP_ID=MMETSP1355-20121228/61160_1 /TAXON_ID=464990 /ORGANISM="Hemiselmis tepida, Strain CCMP443" /LENGTH=54 /DNA_ID=CAMNT_0016184525 /DNA_START=45 /DNA_END=205 /DNA_ORIENTATION=-